MTDWPPHPLVLFASTLVSYHSLFLASFVAGYIKYIRIGGGAAPRGGDIFQLFLHNSHA